MVDGRYCEVTLKIVKICQLKYFIEHMVLTI